MHSHHLPPQSPELTNSPPNQDYHVVLVYKAATTTKPPLSTVYDFDTTLDPFGLSFESYVSKTLYGDKSLWADPDPDIDQEVVLSYVDRHPRFFRLVPAEEYIRLFASTRKHMMKECMDAGGGWLAKPPDYLPIRTKGREGGFEFFFFYRTICYCWG